MTAIMEHATNHPIQTITPAHGAYPAMLAQISDPPKLLYVRGDAELANTMPFVAVVGTRRCTPYGKRATVHIVRELARAGVGIVSGMALGIDTWAHQTALEENGKTIAVLGSAVDDASLYPRANVRLGKTILQKGGAILSEYKTGDPAFPANFPARNRIIAGISKMTIVIEAPYKSGALITARCALDYNREVGAVPGPLFNPKSEGTNYLISKGAICVRSADDILEAMGIDKPAQSEVQTFSSPEEKIVHGILTTSDGPLCADKIIELAKLSPAHALSLITLLALQNKIKDVGGERYIWNA